MSSELRIEDGYENFVSPKRKRMMSPNNCIKISKDQGSTHVQKHREVDFDCEHDLLGKMTTRKQTYANQHHLGSSTSGSPSTNCFIRKPNFEYNRREDFNTAKFGSLKKGNLFGGSDGLARSCSSDEDFDADADADEKANRRLRNLNPRDDALALKKSFAYDRNFKAVRRGSNSSANGTDHENLQVDTDAGTESDFSGVAGKMSALSVGKRSSGFSFPTRRGSPGTSPLSSQNSSMNSSLGLSPALNAKGLPSSRTGQQGGLMEDLLSAAAAGSPQLDLIGRTLFPNESLPSRSTRSKANRLISSAIFNSNNYTDNTLPAATPVATQKSTAALHVAGTQQSNYSVLHNSGSSSANNTHINQYQHHHHSAEHLADRSGLSHRSDHTDALYNLSASSSVAHGSELHDHSNLSIISSSNGSNDSDRYPRHHRLEQHQEHLHHRQGDADGEGDREGEDGHWALGRSVWGEEAHSHSQRHQLQHLPPRTPLVHKQHAYTVHHQQKHTQPHLHGHHNSSSSEHGSHSLSRIEEGEATRPTEGPAAGDLSAWGSSSGSRKAGTASSSMGAIIYDAAGSPVLTPSRGGRRRRGEGGTLTHSRSQSASQSASMSMSQQSVGLHEAAMGDLGTPVAEVGSPVVLEGMEDLVGEDEYEESEFGSEEGEDEEVYAWEDGEEKQTDSPAVAATERKALFGSVKKRDEDDLEVVMITAMQGTSSDSHHKKLVHQRNNRRRRKVRSPFSATSTAGPKGRLFQDDGTEEEGDGGACTPLQREQLAEDDHQYHLFAQQFMVSPTLVAGEEEEELELEPRQFKYHRSNSSEDYQVRRPQQHQQGMDDTLLDSPSSLDSSAVSGGGGRGSLARGRGGSNGSSFSSSLSLTRTNSDMNASLLQHSQNQSHNSRSGMNLTRTNSDTFALSRSDCNNTSTHTGSSSAFLPLPDQSAFDGAGQADLSRSSYDLHLSSSHNSSVDPLFPTPGSAARKKRQVQQLGGSPNAMPPSPLRGLEWGLLGSMGSPAADRKHHMHAHPSHHHHLHANQHGLHGVSQEAHDQLNASSSSSSDASTPGMSGAAGGMHGGGGGIAMHQQHLMRHPSSEGSVGSTGSHDSDIIIAHHWQRKAASGNDESKMDPFQFNSNSSTGSHNPRLPHGHKSGHDSNNNSHSRLPFESADSPSPSGSFSSLAAGRPALVRQSSLLDTKLLLVGQQEEELGPAAHAAVVSFREDFEEVGLLGSGTFADVYKVRQVTPGSDPNHFFAVKKSKQQFKSKRDREWLMAEVRTMKLVGQQQHQGGCPYVVPFIRAWQEDCYFYVQMGFAERGTLRELLLHLARQVTNSNKDNKTGNGSALAEAHIPAPAPAQDALVPDNTVWQVVHDVTSGLHHIHACGMVHLDIKPANLLITAQGRVQIGDFGMAAPINSSDDGREGDTRYDKLIC